MSDRFEHKLEHKLERKPADEAGDAVVDFHRFEVITGTGRRRRWSTDEKARILVESFAPGANVSEVARRNGLTPQQLFGWRREIRDFEESPRAAASASPENCQEAPMSFAPIVVAASTPPPPMRASAAGVIEIVIGDCIVRVAGQVEASDLAAVLRAVRRAS